MSLGRIKLMLEIEIISIHFYHRRKYLFFHPLLSMVCTLYKGVNELETPTKTIFLAPIYLGSKSHFSRLNSGILHPFAQKASGQVLETPGFVWMYCIYILLMAA